MDQAVERIHTRRTLQNVKSVFQIRIWTMLSEQSNCDFRTRPSSDYQTSTFKNCVPEFIDVEVEEPKDSVCTKFNSQGNEAFENADENLRQTLKEKHQKEALQSLQQMFLEMDEETYHQIDVCNPVKVLRWK
ncbi:MAG: hypothetical protein IJF10_00015 [Clostridia bacterium]|nr:hypothetical protein [Clostridia bacterium]